MFNFRELKLDKRSDPNNYDPFIGIRRNGANEFEFRLPIGFGDFPEGNFNLTKQLFFRMYRTFKKFEQDHLRNLSLSKTLGKDNIEVGANAYRFTDKEDNDVVLYSKISTIETMLTAYQDLALNVIERTLQRSEQINFSKIHRYLDKATYLDYADDNHVIHIEEMQVMRSTLQYKSTNIIELFCFILSELQQELEQTIDERVNELSNKFREQHLTCDQSLFNEETFETTIIDLKEILDDINKTTAYKDNDYWQLYEAIETFLYGELDMQNTHEDGIFWGISNFWQVWEDMCHTYAFKNFDNILYADTNISINGKPVANQMTDDGHKIFCKDGFDNPFFIEFLGKKRWMRPDFLYIKLPDKQVKKLVEQKTSKSLQKIQKLISDINKKIICTFLDWKYYSYNSCLSDNNQIQLATIKQLSYELILKKYSDYAKHEIESSFFIPFFYPSNYLFKERDSLGENIDTKRLAEILSKNKIKVFKANFLEIQRTYLSL